MDDGTSFRVHNPLIQNLFGIRHGWLFIGANCCALSRVPPFVVAQSTGLAFRWAESSTGAPAAVLESRTVVRALTTCPNCGNEVKEDFSFCPFCETPLKPFCPSCKRELEPGYVRCPYCGFRLGSQTPAKKLYVKGGRSRFLSFIIVLTFVSGIVDIIQGTSEGQYQYANYVYQGPIPAVARYLALAQVPIGVLVVLIGIVQFFIFYGLVYGKVFSRKYILKLVGLTFVLSLAMFSLDGMMSLVFSLSPLVLSFDIFFVLWSFFVLVVVWRYVIVQETRAILSSTGVS